MRILVDMMSVVFISFYATIGQMRKQGKDEFTKKDVPFFLHFLFNKMNMFFSTYGKLDICWDGRKSLEWRRSIYPIYKMNRESRKKEPSYQILMNTIPKIKEGLNLYPCRQIEIENAEADDVLFALTEKYVGVNEHVLVITADGDLGQLILFFGADKVEVYHPIKKIYIKPSAFLLEEKAIVGDISDNIKGLFRVGEKTFEKMIADKDFYNEVLGKKDNREVFNKLLKIIDLRIYPFKQGILQTERNVLYNKFQPDNIEFWFWDNRLKDLLMKWSKIKNDISKKL